MPEEVQEDKRAEWNENVRIVTMREQGARLPIGTADLTTGELVKEIEHRRWNLRIEKQIGAYRDDNRRANMGHYAAVILAKLCTKLGSLVLTGNDKNTKKEQLSISQLFLGDVLYAYFWLRRNALGPICNFEVPCAKCGGNTKVPADLDTLEIRVVDRLEDTHWSYDLIEPMAVRGTEIKRFAMQQARWSVIQGITGGGLNTGSIKSNMILNSIAGAEGLDKVVLVEHELDDLSKRDVEQLSAEIERRNIGPDVAIEAVCSKCKSEIRVSIDWAYDVFFSDSGGFVP